MSNFFKSLLIGASVLAACSAAQASNLLVNGGFEGSTSPTTTPPGWFNIGHSDGVIKYSAFGTPAYEGVNFYDLGGYGNASGPIGDGIAQTFSTVANAAYTVTFGLSSENSYGTETLTVSAGNVTNGYVLAVDSLGVFKKPFATQSFTFVAQGASTTLSFVHTAGAGGGNDPLIDGVSVTAAVPEPETYALLLAGLGLMGAAVKRRKAKQA